MKKLLLVLSFCLTSLLAFAQQPKVLVFKIDDMIDPRMKRHVELALEKATAIKADFVIIEMDTYGGVLQDADAIRRMILDYPQPIYVYIDKNAASAGALISIACDSIYMSKGASIGAATVVNGSDGAKAPDKYQSYMRGIMRSTAEAQGRDPRIAEAMVDEFLEVDTISIMGQVITFTADEAKKYGYCENIVSSIDEIMELNYVQNPEFVRYERNTVEGVIAFFLNPAVSSILILIILGGIYYELQSPGIGFPLAAACLAGILYFVPYYLTDLAAIWELIALIVGLGLIAAEVFVIPGFGVAGISGIIITLGSLMLMMLNNDYFDFEYIEPDSVSRALVVGTTSFIGTIVLIAVGLSTITKTRFFKKMALQDTLDTKEGYTSNFNTENLKGLTGSAYTVLRPSGKVFIDDEIYDASTRGEYIEKGTSIIVIAHEGGYLKVKATS